MHNIELSNFLWGTDNNSNSWEYIYFLQEVSQINIPYRDFNRSVGYSENNVIQGFDILKHNLVDAFLNIYPLESLTYIQTVKENEYFTIISNPLAKLDNVDGKILSTQRKEQAFLRRSLFQGKTTAKCSICGEEFPISLLCCSHIKKRCYCTLNEKKDYQNIVTPMCSLGCDKLFENGYIAVDDGQVIVLKLTSIPNLDRRIKSLEGRRVLEYSESNKKYYAAHLSQHSNSNKGQKCHYPTRLDTYGCGCQHDCKYCYAKSLLEFRNLWHVSSPSIADIKKIEDKIKTLSKGQVVRLGGMTDCFQPCENEYRITYKTIQLLNKYGIHYLIVTKSDMIASDEYIKILNKNLAHIQITVTCTNDKLSSTYEKATPPSKRMLAIEKLETLGFDVQIRLSPFIPEYVDLNVIANLKCRRAIIEFLRVNAFIKRTFNINYTPYTIKEGNYYHLPLKTKINLINKVALAKEVSVCEDNTQAYDYWKKHVNPFPDDCCNLVFKDSIRNIGPLSLLYQHKIAFLCSMTNNVTVINNVNKWLENIIKTDACIISGFQSQIEKHVLDKLLNSKVKIIMVLAKKIYNSCPKKYENAIHEGRMLIISPYATDNFTTRECAFKRNQYVMNHANTLILGYVKQSGMLDSLIKTYKNPYEILTKEQLLWQTITQLSII